VLRVAVFATCVRHGRRGRYGPPGRRGISCAVHQQNTTIARAKLQFRSFDQLGHEQDRAAGHDGEPRCVGGESAVGQTYFRADIGWATPVPAVVRQPVVDDEVRWSAQFVGHHPMSVREAPGHGYAGAVALDVAGDHVTHDAPLKSVVGSHLLDGLRMCRLISFVGKEKDQRPVASDDEFRLPDASRLRGPDLAQIAPTAASSLLR
jgi:hypothetical protein